MQFSAFPLHQRLNFAESSMLAYRALLVERGASLPVGLAHTYGLVNIQEWFPLLEALNPDMPDVINAPRGENFYFPPFIFAYLLYFFCQLDAVPSAEEPVIANLEQVKRDAIRWATARENRPL
jgi:hypothetical protein